MRATRRQALVLAGAAGAAYAVTGRWPAAAPAQTTPQCTLTGARTVGPYFVDEKLDRADITTDPTDGKVSEGVPLFLGFKVVDSANGCVPVAGAQVDIWHCDAGGAYSDFEAEGTAGRKFLRGFQTTDADGACQFKTIFPGWYEGRTVHIHFKVRKDGEDFTSQLFFDEAQTQQALTNAAYKADAPRRIRNERDGIFGADGASLVVALAGNPTQGYAGTFVVGLAGTPAAPPVPAAGPVGVSAAVTRRAGRRTLKLRVEATRAARIKVRVARGQTVLARRTAEVAAGTQTVRLAIPRRVRAGDAALRVAVEGAEPIVSRIRIPRRRA